MKAKSKPRSAKGYQSGGLVDPLNFTPNAPADYVERAIRRRDVVVPSRRQGQPTMTDLQQRKSDEYIEPPGRGYRSGGKVRGKKGVDKVPIKATAGEYVVKKSTVQKVGKPAMDRLNRGRARVVPKARKR